VNVEYLQHVNKVVVYYEMKMLFRGPIIAPCIITLDEWINQGGE